MQNKIDAKTVEMLKNDSKIGVLATMDDDGYPHLTFISSLMALGDDQIIWGKFCEGMSKKLICKRPDVQFLALNADMDFVRGSARFTHTETTGEEYDLFNNKPLFRYNSYFGFSKIFYMDLLNITDLHKLKMPKIVIGAILTRIAAIFHTNSKNKALTKIGKDMFSELDSLKFLCYADSDGLHSIVPIIQAGAAGTDRIVFSTAMFGSEIKKIPNGAKAAILCVNLKMESVLTQGVFKTVTGVPSAGVFDIERVYNSMPPLLEYIYPREQTIREVSSF